MTKRNLVVLIIGIGILLILVGGFSYIYFKNKTEVVAPTPTPQPPATITFCKDEEKTLSRLMGLPSDQIPSVYKEKVALFKEKLKNDCLSKKDDVKQFVLAVKNDDSIGNLLVSMKDITVSADLIPNKTSPTGTDTGFKIHSFAILECYNLDKDKFTECQSRLNGLEIDNVNAEEAAMTKYNSESPRDYLICKAAEQGNRDYCSKFFFSLNYRSDCQTLVKWYDFATSIYSQPDCENLCQTYKENIDVGDAFFHKDMCKTLCQAVKNSDLKECEKLSLISPDKNLKVQCDAIVTLDANICQKIDPKIPGYKYPDGSIVQKDESIDCRESIIYYKSIKENNSDILSQAVDPNSSNSLLYFFKNLYFGKTGCEDRFDIPYNNYCNLKYSL